MLAKLYHAHHKAYQEDIPFWKQFAEGATALELGCGTGRVAIPLARAGCSVWGIDRDQAMLEVAGTNLAGEPDSVRERVFLLQADMTQFCAGARFGAVISPCNTFSVLDVGEREAVYQTVTGHLESKGVFAVSLPNPAILAQLRGESEGETSLEEVFPHPQTGNPVQASSAIEGTQGGVTWRWHYDHLLPDGQVERLTMSTKHYHVPVEVYKNEIANAGLCLDAVYGDFEKGEYTPESRHLILVARLLD
ncbi:MAG: Ubiquinone biosynthesis O-methyltransferase [Chloroflexi bacterium]|nr:Ubiquinone biosynthesis O-methyltransferase [Chloroflexota bacterium]